MHVYICMYVNAYMYMWVYVYVCGGGSLCMHTCGVCLYLDLQGIGIKKINGWSTSYPCQVPSPSHAPHIIAAAYVGGGGGADGGRGGGKVNLLVTIQYPSP